MAIDSTYADTQQPMDSGRGCMYTGFKPIEFIAKWRVWWIW